MGRWCAVGSVLKVCYLHLLTAALWCAARDLAVQSAAVAQHLLLKGIKEQGVWS